MIVRFRLYPLSEQTNMSFNAIWNGSDEENTTALVLITPHTSARWTYPATGFVWTSDGIHGHLPSSHIFVFEHLATSCSAILKSSVSLLTEIANIRNTNAKFLKRPWLLVGHGAGGLVVKNMLVASDLATNGIVGLLLLDAPNMSSFETYEDFVKVMEHFDNSGPISDSERTSFEQMRQNEVQFAAISHRIVPLISGFSIQSA